MTSEGEASDKCEEESEAGGGARGEIEIDISSLESNSEVSRHMNTIHKTCEVIYIWTGQPLRCIGTCL